jgi:hypothetical protein
MKELVKDMKKKKESRNRKLKENGVLQMRTIGLNKASKKEIKYNKHLLSMEKMNGLKIKLIKEW